MSEKNTSEHVLRFAGDLEAFLFCVSGMTNLMDVCLPVENIRIHSMDGRQEWESFHDLS